MPGTEVLVRRRTSPMKLSFVRPKPLARRLSAKRRANKTRIRPVLSLGSPGSPLALADGIAITNRQAQRPCEPVGTNSKPWQPVMLLQALDKIRESRSPADTGAGLPEGSVPAPNDRCGGCRLDHHCRIVRPGARPLCDSLRELAWALRLRR